MKIILFGGSFDPIHKGHLDVARYSFEKIGADKLFLIPAKRSPHKKDFPFACDDARLNMLRLAIRETTEFEVSDMELKRADPSYTIDTVFDFKHSYGDSAEIFLLIGADTVEDLGKWHRIGELIDACNVCVMYRSGFKRPNFTEFREHLGQKRVEKLDKYVISTPLIDISSTDIRRNIGQGCDVSAFVPQAVLGYIEQKGLYLDADG
ncbi:MAG: nicotinate (nicotinamide) nucleotide adenylyltransferase [Planctomycetes bacterium]|nr:nicotinate (nicotinamide) nucleotide adenylyltransferase [Planctomycetota bacterium]